MDKKTIFISISRGSLLSTFLHSGIVSRLLDNNLRVVILTPNYQDKEFFVGYEHPDLFLEPLIAPRDYKYERLIKEFLKGAIFNKTVHVRYKFRFSGKQPRSWLYWPRLILMAPLKYVPGFKKFIRWLDFKLNPQPEHDYLFEKYKPTLAFATTAHTESDIGVLKSAKRFGIQTVNMPKSWDNLSKILFHVKTDKMLVWSPFMQEQAVEFQGYKKAEVIVTGVPQFDYYLRREKLISREEFCQAFNFDPQLPIISYASTGGNCFHESEYLELIKKYIDEKKIPPVQVLIRPHLGYVGDTEKFVQLEKYPGFVVDRTDKQSHKFKDHWDASLQHIDHLHNSLHHAAMCINIASTITLDAVACDTPALNINFDVNPDIDPNFSTKRLYTTDYINAVTSIGGTWLASSEAEFLQILQDILVKGEKKAAQRQALIDYFMYKNDGHAAERLATALITLANK